jgi:dihydrolipoamide dehydrogenase
MDDQFDLVVIGGGPGGYPAAIRAAQNGLNVALVEGKEMGGTCLNRGCIPTKTLIANANVLKQAEDAEEFGILTGGITFDYGRMVDRKDRVVGKIRKGVEGLMASNKITLIRGWAEYLSPTEIKVKLANGEDKIIHANKSVIATGSEPREIPAFKVDGAKVHDSTTVLNLKALPKKMVIIGGGIIGCEFASLFKTLDVEVVVVEMLPTLLPLEAKSVSDAIMKHFMKQGIKYFVGTLVERLEHQGDQIEIVLGNGEKVTTDMALVAVGRSLNTNKVGLDKAGVHVNEKGFVLTNEHMETNVPGIYAVGDIASKWWLAHVATHQGIVAGDHAAGIDATMHYEAVPSVIYTTPEIATVGLSLEQAIEKEHDASVSMFPYQAIGKAQAENHTDGFAQIVWDKKTGAVIGAQIVGHDAGTLIAEMTLAIQNELTIESVTETIHAHPTIAEIWLEAALQAHEKPLHMPPRRKAS